MSNDRQLPAQQRTQVATVTDLSLQKGSLIDQLTPVEFCKFAVQSGYFEAAGITDVSQAIVKVAFGEKMGIDPLTALNSLYITKGKVSMEPAAIYDALCNHPRYGCDIIEQVDTHCTVQITWDGKPKLNSQGKPVPPVTFTYDQACGLGFAGRNAVQWKHNRLNMLLYKAAAFAQRAYARDLFKNVPVYGVDEIENEHDGVIDAQLVESPATKQMQQSFANAEQRARERDIRGVQAQGQPATPRAVETPTSSETAPEQKAEAAASVSAAEGSAGDTSPSALPPAEDMNRPVTTDEVKKFEAWAQGFGWTPGALKFQTQCPLTKLTVSGLEDLRAHVEQNPKSK